MKEYKCIAFDLDGTLTDPAEGLVNGFVYAFKKLGIDYGERDALRRFIGPPLFECWRREFGFSAEEADEAIELFREYYTVFGWRENKIYDGIAQMLGELKRRGKTLVVATSKPEDQARRIIRLFGLDEYFDYVGGAVCHHNRATKREVLAYSLAEAGAVDLSSCVMVGDRVFDAEGAAALGIDSVGVLWGHGDASEISSAGFIHTVCDPDELLSLLS